MSAAEDFGIIDVEKLLALVRREARAEAEKVVAEKLNSTNGHGDLTVRQLADLKGVRPRTVYDWVSQKKVPHYYTPGGQLRFKRKLVEGLDLA